LIPQNKETFLERLAQAILDVIHNPKRLEKLPVSERYHDYRSNRAQIF
jgi:hypothetical protein